MRNKKAFLFTLFCGLLLLLVACTGYRVESPDGEVAVEVGGDETRDREFREYDKGGPPPWAPAHGYRRKQAYYYYPKGEFYYNQKEDKYIWLEAGGWKIGAELPLRLQDELRGPRVEVELEGDSPAPYHDRIKAYYQGKEDYERGGGVKKRKGGPPRGRGRGAH